MRTLCFFIVLIAAVASTKGADFPTFKIQEIDPRAGDVCYAVAVADVNGDKKPDVVVATEDAVVWYENPVWFKRDIIRGATARDNVCIQPHDVDGDGRIDFALGAGWRPSDTSKPSTLQWLGRDPHGKWRLNGIACEEPTLHRIRWGQIKNSKRKQLVIAPLQGRGTKGPNWEVGSGTRILVYDIPDRPESEPWNFEVADVSLHTVHNIQLVDLDGDQRDEIVAAAWEGLFVLDREPAGTWTKTRIGTGNTEAQPFKGASEVKRGRWRGGRPYFATIEPWHGFQVVAYTSRKGGAIAAAGTGQLPTLLDRRVIAEPLQWGHAVWCANLDGDADDELIIGQRDPNRPGTPGPRGPGLFVFDPDPASDSLAFNRHVIDDGGIACEDAVAHDLDGDGRTDIIAGGRATHNVRIYWNKKAPARR
jgi:hypothetical protein